MLKLQFLLLLCFTTNLFEQLASVTLPPWFEANFPEEYSKIMNKKAEKTTAKGQSPFDHSKSNSHSGSITTKAAQVESDEAETQRNKEWRAEQVENTTEQKGNAAKPAKGSRRGHDDRAQYLIRNEDQFEATVFNILFLAVFVLPVVMLGATIVAAYFLNKK